jgi:Ni/Co efflux regulator RcnB
MSSSNWFSRFVIVVIAFALCGGPQLMAAQQTAPAQQTQTDPQQNNASQDSDQQNNAQPDNSQQNVGTTPSSATPDPSKGPLKPNESELPNAPSASQKQQQTSSSSQSQQPEPKEAPLGAAAAQAGKTSGGAASRPAGTAIAPAKQRQTRSLLIKVGAIAAGAAALGIVYGLTRSTPSLPPGASTATTTTTTTSAAH